MPGGGQGRNRTADASLFRAALYQLSYLAFGDFNKLTAKSLTILTSQVVTRHLLRLPNPKQSKYRRSDIF